MFLDHYKTCENVKQIQVIWSDQTKDAPFEWLQNYPTDKVVFEVHTSNSLNNRFQSLIPVHTEVSVVKSPEHSLIPVNADRSQQLN